MKRELSIEQQHKRDDAQDNQRPPMAQPQGGHAFPVLPEHTDPEKGN